MMFVKEEPGKNLDNFFYEYCIRFHATSHVGYFFFPYVCFITVYCSKQKQNLEPTSVIPGGGKANKWDGTAEGH